MKIDGEFEISIKANNIKEALEKAEVTSIGELRIKIMNGQAPRLNNCISGIFDPGEEEEK
jgi:hypothetical protein